MKVLGLWVGSAVLAAAPAFTETRVVTAGAQYRASGLHEIFFGADYRALWATPIEVEVLDLASFASGLTPVRRVGGMQTKSLAMRGGDGRSYTFRSLDKDPSGALPPELQGTIATKIIRDQTSGGHPAGPMVAAGLLEAAGVRNARPRLVVMPDDASLGEFREVFAGVVGTIQEFPTAGFAGSTAALSANDARERFQAGPGDRPDAKAFLRVRLVDLLVGDWDRHRGQWRWVLVPEEPLWQPVPEDRDQAFARYEGLLLSIARSSWPKLVAFGPEYPHLEGLTFNGWEQDRQILSVLEWADWEPIVADVQGRITNDVIESSIARMPAAYAALDGPRLGAALRIRRDGLAKVARRFYERLNRDLDLWLTDAAEEVEIVHGAGGELEVGVRAAGADAPYVRRRVRAQETREVRLNLRGGNDRVVTRGARGKVLVRVIGGAGDDVLDDYRGGGTRFSDSDGRVTPGPGTRHDARPYAAPVNPKAPLDPPRDWGGWTMPLPWLAGSPDLGLFVGGGFMKTDYGFRKHPWASVQMARGGWATAAQRARLEYEGAFHRENSRTRFDLAARASGIEILRFHGFGNETAISGPKKFYEAEQQQYSLAPSVAFGAGAHGELSIGPVVQYATTELAPNGFIAGLRPYGTDPFGQAGLRLRASWDSRDRPRLPEKGLFAALEARSFPAAWDVEEAFTDVHAEAAAVVTAAHRLTLAARVGGKRVFGTYPFHEAAFIGGADTVRGFPAQRFAGDAAAWGNVELRVFVTRFFVILPGELGVFGLSDAGRVFLGGESSDRWHTSVGGGLWISVLNRQQTMSVAVARSRDRTAAYVRGGLSF